MYLYGKEHDLLAYHINVKLEDAPKVEEPKEETPKTDEPSTD